MDPEEKEFLEKTYRVARDNNRMLKAMRRNAFIGGIIKLIIWALVLGIPVFLYVQYIHPVLGGMVETFDQAQGTGAEFGAQFQRFSSMFESIPGFSQGE